MYITIHKRAFLKKNICIKMFLFLLKKNVVVFLFFFKVHHLHFSLKLITIKNTFKIYQYHIPVNKYKCWGIKCRLSL